MMYQTQWGDSPTGIAAKFGVSMNELILANPQKPVQMIAGQYTWQTLRPGEQINVPATNASGQQTWSPIPQQQQWDPRRRDQGRWTQPDQGHWTRPAVPTAVAPPWPQSTATAVAPPWYGYNRRFGFAGLGAVAPAPLLGPHAEIKQGSTGADVVLWQSIVGTTQDGIFGPQTAAATKTWQSAHSLSADGIVGPLTWGAAMAAGGGGGSVPTIAPVSPGIVPASASVTVSAMAAAAALATDPNYCSSVKQAGTAVNTTVHNFKAAWNSANPGNQVPINTGNYEPSVASALQSALGGVPVPPGCGASPNTPPPLIVPPSIPSIPGIPSIIPSIPNTPIPSIPGITPAQPTITPPSTNPNPGGVSTGALIAGGLGLAALLGVVGMAVSSSKKGGGGGGGVHRAPARRAPIHHRAPARKSKKRK